MCTEEVLQTGIYDCDGNPTGRMLSFSSGDSDQPSSMDDTQSACTLSTAEEPSCTQQTQTLTSPTIPTASQPLPTPQITPQITPEHRNTLIPTKLFPNPPTCSSSLMLNKSVERDEANVQCSIENLVSCEAQVPELHTKAATLIHKVIGHNADLSRFDALRTKLKQNKKVKPTTTEKEEYETLLTKLHNAVLSTKYCTKDKLKAMEQE